jgi:ABC-2 type transport system permease protein
MLAAQTRAELAMTLRRGESVLLALGIPLMLLVFFSTVEVVEPPAGTADRIDFVAPGVLALAVLSAAFTGPAIATAFERQYGVLKRIGTTPLGRPRLLGAKIAAIVAVQLLQVVVLTGAAIALGWRPDGDGAPAVLLAVVVATIAFCGLALLVAGSLRAEAVLAVANGVHVALLLGSGMVIPLEQLPGAAAALARLLPSTGLAEVVRGALDAGTAVPGRAWGVLVAWAVIGPVLAIRRFRWE